MGIDLEVFYENHELVSHIQQHLKGKSIGISGSEGFLGVNWIHFLNFLNRRFNSNISIYTFDIKPKGFPRDSSDITNHKVCDVSKELELETELDFFIHAASIASPTFYRRYPLETVHANVNGTELVLEEAKKGKIKRVLLLSSSEVYGNPDKDCIPTSEDYFGNVSFFGPRACYDESKRLAETLVWIYVNYYEVDAVVVRPFNVYGPGQSLQDRRIIPDIMNALIYGEELEVFSDGAPTRTFCFVSDFIIGSLITLCSGVTGEAYNIGNDSPEISIGDLVKLVARVSPDSNFRFKQALSSDEYYLKDNPARRCPDISKAKKSFSWSPKVRLENGLISTISYYKDRKL